MDRLVSPNGKYELKLQDDGNAPVYRIADGKVISPGLGGDPEFQNAPSPEPEPEPGPEPPQPVTGRVSLNGRCLTLDGVPRLWLAHSLFYAARDVFEGNAGHLKANLDWLRDHHVDAVRILCETTDWTRIYEGGPGATHTPFRDRSIDPRWPNYSDVLHHTIEQIRQCGLRASVTIFGGNQLSTVEQDRCVDDVFAVLSARRNVILDVEIANENQGRLTEEQYRRYATRFMGAGFIVSLTSVEHGSGLYDRVPASWASYHFDRKRGDNDWRIVRQPWGTRGEYGDKLSRMAFRSGEPAGTGTSVESYTDAEILAQQAVHTWLCGGGLHVVHSGSGIYGVQTQHPVGGNRPPDLWNQEALTETLDRIAVYRALLPADLPNWARTRHGMADHPFTFPPDAAQTVGDKAIDAGNGCVRAYAAYASGRYICVPIGVMGSCTLQAQHTDTSYNLRGEKGRSYLLSGNYR